MLGVVVGGDSRLGLRLGRALRVRAWRVVMTTRRACAGRDYQFHWAPLDLLEPRFPASVIARSEKAVVFIVAAATGVVQCERDPQTWRVNADAPSVLTAIARCWGWQVVFVSSDAVECAPHTAYAMQKAHAEAVVLSLGGHVVRPARIAPEKYDEVAELLAAVGEELAAYPDRPPSITRWEG